MSEDSRDLGQILLCILIIIITDGNIGVALIRPLITLTLEWIIKRMQVGTRILSNRSFLPRGNGSAAAVAKINVIEK